MPAILTSDQPNHKGISGRPFVADTHGGLIPWTDPVEWVDGWTIPAPTVTAYWLLEAVRNLSHEVDAPSFEESKPETPDINSSMTQNGLGTLDVSVTFIDPGPPEEYEVTITPLPVAESVIEHADYPNIIPTMLYRPRKPRLAVNVGVNIDPATFFLAVWRPVPSPASGTYCNAATAIYFDFEPMKPLGFEDTVTPWWIGRDPGLDRNTLYNELALFRGFAPTKDVVSAQTMRFGRITGAPYDPNSVPSHPNGDEFGSTDFTHMWITYGPSGDIDDWTAEDVDCPVTTSMIPYSCLRFVPMYGGWAYATQLDHETGVVREAVPIPEPCAVVARVMMPQFDPAMVDVTFPPPTFYTNMFGYACQCFAISWPTGIRKFLGRWESPVAPGTSAWLGRLYWRPAPAWRWLVPTRKTTGIATVDWNGVSFERGPNLLDQPLMKCFRAMDVAEIASHFGTYRVFDGSPLPAASSPWNVLADFSGTDSEVFVEATMGGTLPAEGQEIIIFGGTNRRGVYSVGFDPLHFWIAPEPGKSPVPLPLARGGILQ